MAGSTLRLGEPSQQARTLNRVLRHPQFNFNLNNDVAILYWAQPLTFVATVGPVTLPPQDSPAPYGQNANVTGWGIVSIGASAPNVLQVVAIPLVSIAECNRAYNGSVTPTMLCAGSRRGGRSACLGDQGGPLVRNGVQLGVVSWSRGGCGRPQLPGVYARVASFTTWINANL